MKNLFPLAVFLGLSNVISCPQIFAGEVSYKLINGDTITGNLMEELSTEKIKVINHPNLGIIEISQSSIRSETTPKNWHSSVNIGFSGSTAGANNEFDYSFEGKTIYSLDKNTMEVNASVENKKSNKEVISRKGGVDVRYDRFFGKLSSLYSYTDYKLNTLNTVGVNELTTSIGVARKILNRDKHKLSFSIGPGINFYSGGSLCSIDKDCDKLIPATLLSTSYQIDITSKISLELDDTFSTAFSSNTKIGNDFSTTLRYYPMKDSKFNTSLKYEINYDSEIKPSTDRGYKFLLGTTF